MVVCQKDVTNVVEVPVNVIGSENSPGIKKGGYLNLIQYVARRRSPAAPYRAPSSCGRGDPARATRA